MQDTMHQTTTTEVTPNHNHCSQLTCSRNRLPPPTHTQRKGNSFLTETGQPPPPKNPVPHLCSQLHKVAATVALSRSSNSIKAAATRCCSTFPAGTAAAAAGLLGLDGPLHQTRHDMWQQHIHTHRSGGQPSFRVWWWLLVMPQALHQHDKRYS